MNRYEQAVAYHHKGFNCCQSVLAAYSDLTGLSQQASFDMGGGFGAGAQTGELCGAITGAILTLGMLTPVDPQDPVGSKRRTGALAKEFQKRFQEKFGDLRCKPLLKAGIQATDATSATVTAMPFCVMDCATMPWKRSPKPMMSVERPG